MITPRAFVTKTACTSFCRFGIDASADVQHGLPFAAGQFGASGRGPDGVELGRLVWLPAEPAKGILGASTFDFLPSFGTAGYAEGCASGFITEKPRPDRGGRFETDAATHGHGYGAKTILARTTGQADFGGVSRQGRGVTDTRLTSSQWTSVAP